MTGRARRLALAIGVASCAGALAVACSFPDVSFALAGGEDGGDAGDGALDGAPGTDGAADAGLDAPSDALPPDVDPEGSAKDASTVGDAATKVDAAGCATCDCDGDGFNRMEPGAGCNGGPGNNLPDCDDLIKAIHPGQGFVVDPWPADSDYQVVGDWDCDGKVTKQYPYDSSCAALSKCADGFVGDPPCGGTATYETCKQPLPVLGLTCSVDTSANPGDRVQGCH